MRIQLTLGITALALAGFSGGTTAYGSFHFMQIEQVIGGVGGDTSAQAIQLRMRSAGQNIVSASRVVVRDAAGLNPIIIRDMTSNVANSLAGERVLIASANFTNHTSPAVVPDFIMDQLIPASYLAAGRLTFEDDFGTIYWSLSWGGASYTGSHTGNTSNDADGNYGPAFNGPLPSDGVTALKFSGIASTPSVSNATDYTVTPGAATFVNNARGSFTVFAPFESRITSIMREADNIRVTWTTLAGKTNALQRVLATENGGLSTNFIDIFVVTNYFGSTTNFLDIGAATNSGAGYYRARVVP